MSASAPAVPTVRVPNTVTGAVSGSLNGYTITGQPASGTVAVDGDTYTYIPTAVARLRAALKRSLITTASRSAVLTDRAH